MQAHRCSGFSTFAAIASGGVAISLLVAWGLAFAFKGLPLVGALLVGAFFAVGGMLAAGAKALLPSMRQCHLLSTKLTVMDKVIEASSEAVVITDHKNLIIETNDAFTRITGYTKEEVLGKDPGYMKSGRHDSDFYLRMWEDIKTTGGWHGEVWDRRKDGEIYPKWLTIRTIMGEDGNILKYIGVFSDITPVKESQNLHEFLAHYDTLTRLPNRALFGDRLRQAMAQSDKDELMTAMLLVDLDRFKNINDTLGHAAGDTMLKAVAERIKGCVRERDTVARLGGDEFAVILTGVSKESTAVSVAKKIIEAIYPPVKHGHFELRSTASVGITLYPIDGDKPNQLLKNAEIAMYHAKEGGNNTYRLFTGELQEKIRERQRIESNLRQALEKDELVLHYQPQVDIRTGKITGMEALIRRQESDWLVPPGVFIPVAEETGLIMQIADWTLIESCSQVKKWVDMGLQAKRVAVNISATHFNSPRFVKDVDAVLKRTGLDPSLLEIELTERVIMHKADEVTKKINQLKAMGLHLSIDDFGTGYSSLSYLKRFKVDKLKIDYSFVKDIGEGGSSSGATIVKAIISLAHNLGFIVIAEGVEKKEQLDFLIEEGCDEVQGFYFSFPLPANKFQELLEGNKTLPL